LPGCLIIFTAIVVGWTLYAGWPLPGPRGRGTADVHVLSGALTIAEGQAIRFGGPCTYEIRPLLQTPLRFRFHLEDSTSGVGMTIAFRKPPRPGHYVLDGIRATGGVQVEYSGVARNQVRRFAWAQGELTVEGRGIPNAVHAWGMLFEPTGGAARFEASCRITQALSRVPRQGSRSARRSAASSTGSRWPK